MWKTVKLGDLLEVQNGYAFNSKQFDAEGDMPLIRIRDLKNAVNTETRYTGDYDEKYVVTKGDLLIGMDGEFRCYEWQGSSALLNQRVCRLQNFDADLNQRFLLYAINDELKKIEDVTGFTTVKHLSSKSIKGIELPLPPLAEQQRIVAKLDAAFAEIDKAIALSDSSTNNALLVYSHIIDELFERYRNERVSLGSLSSINYGYTAKASHEKGTYKLLRITDIQNNTVDWKTVPYCEVEQKKITNVMLHDGDIVFARTGATTGKSFLVENPKDAVFASYLIRVSVDRDKLIPRYVMHYFQSASYWQQVVEGTSGAAQGGFNASKLSELNIPLVPKDTQQALIEKLDDVLVASKQIANIHQKKSKKLSILKSAILAQELSPSEAA